MNLEEFDINLVIKKLKDNKKIFISESDLQFSIANVIQEIYPNAKIRLEYSPQYAPSVHIDILVIINNNWYPIELKYKTKKYKIEVDNENFVLKEHGAIPINSYLYLKDIQRLENFRNNISEFKNGYAIFITNDLGYLKSPIENNLIYKQFALEDNSIKSGSLNWEENAGEGTKKNREEPIELNDSYKLNWKCYSNLDNDNGKFMYLISVIKSK